eukprot:TRINITY_DN20124_c0_g1_i1.p1 TRINITY_DN20124_c0_g1~~TRINITY_DN20124_c0_g1_i1.p1  ORF type:complete len:228 (-),score=17.03 TRINITY_DN20124_c0_g1_i1:347-1030(-)
MTSSNVTEQPDLLSKLVCELGIASKLGLDAGTSTSVAATLGEGCAACHSGDLCAETLGSLSQRSGSRLCANAPVFMPKSRSDQVEQKSCKVTLAPSSLVWLNGGVDTAQAWLESAAESLRDGSLKPVQSATLDAPSTSWLAAARAAMPKPKHTSTCDAQLAPETSWLATARAAMPASSLRSSIGKSQHHGVQCRPSKPCQQCKLAWARAAEERVLALSSHTKSEALT